MGFGRPTRGSGRVAQLVAHLLDAQEAPGSSPGATTDRLDRSHSGVEQLAARGPHKPKVAGSSPASATRGCARNTRPCRPMPAKPDAGARGHGRVSGAEGGPAHAPVPQLDRGLGYEPRRRRFESSRVRKARLQQAVHGCGHILCNLGGITRDDVRHRGGGGGTRPSWSFFNGPTLRGEQRPKAASRNEGRSGEATGCGAVASAPALGAGCRGFESRHPDCGREPLQPLGCSTIGRAPDSGSGG